ncbi:MAG: TlpA family protein disulfide reductase [Myxococcaceae bacterium]|nr:TlpA family protein disulfide reductase [Myxococcaceae bacterium]
MNARTWVIAVMVLSSVPALADELAETGKHAPMFRLPVYNAKEVGATVVGLDRYVGSDAQDKQTRVVLLTFMASFCAPCKKEMPYLQSLYEKYSAKGLRIVSVSIDTEPEGQKQIDELIAKNHVTYPVLKDRFNLVARRWLGTRSPLPSVFLVKPDGTIASSHRGYSKDIAELLEGEVLAALGIGAPAKPANTAATTPP